jgi:hypothetical protein
MSEHQGRIINQVVMIKQKRKLCMSTLGTRLRQRNTGSHFKVNIGAHPEFLALKSSILSKNQPELVISRRFVSCPSLEAFDKPQFPGLYENCLQSSIDLQAALHFSNDSQAPFLLSGKSFVYLSIFSSVETLSQFSRESAMNGRTNCSKTSA